MALLRSHFESALNEHHISPQKILSLPPETQQAVQRMMDAYSQGDQNEGFRVVEEEKDRLAQDREGIAMKEYLVVVIQIDTIHSICRALLLRQRILLNPMKSSPN